MSAHTPVYLESPYGNPDPDVIKRNIRYLRACMRDSLLRGEAPFASHAQYTQPGVLRDEDPLERMHGIEAGFAFRPACKRTVVYVDLGVSKGMQLGMEAAHKLGQPVEHRELGPDWEQAHVLETLQGVSREVW